MTDLRKAAEMALEALEEINKLSVGEKAICLPAEIDTAMDVIREALAEQPAPAQEPFAWADLNALTEQFNSVNCGTAYRLPGEGRDPLYTTPQPPAQPLTDEQKTVLREFQKREWVGLTDDEVWDLWNAHTEQPFPDFFVDFKRSYAVIEAKLKEKNT